MLILLKKKKEKNLQNSSKGKEKVPMLDLLGKEKMKKK